MAAGDRQLTPAAAVHGGSRPRRRAGLAGTVLETYCLLWLGTMLVAVLAIPIAGFISVSLRHWREYREIEKLVATVDD